MFHDSKGQSMLTIIRDELDRLLRIQDSLSEGSIFFILPTRRPAAIHNCRDTSTYQGHMHTRA